MPTFAARASGVLLFVPLLAQDPAPEAPREWIGGVPFTSWTRMTGDWGGVRNDLELAGVEVAGGYTADLAAPWTGDTRRRSTYSSLLDVNAAFDLETLLGLPRTFAYVDAYSIKGRNPSDDVGDYQWVSNIAAPNVDQIAELWVETWLFDELRVKLGKVDFNSEFAFHEIGGEFVHSTAAIVPTIVAYPTYPDPATAINLFWHPSELFYAGVGVFDGANAEGVRTGTRGPSGFFGGDDSDAYFYAAEIGLGWTGGESWGSGRCALGAFHHTATFERFDGGTERGTSGVWFNLEQRVWRENPSEDDGQGIGVFLSLGRADDAVADCGSAVGVGVEWTGPLPSRDFDVLGLGVFSCDLSDERDAGTPADETAIELFYKVQLTPWVSLKPELQLVRNPGGQEVDDVLVGLLRVEIAF